MEKSGNLYPESGKGTILAGLWQIPYEEGELCAVACDENGTVLAKDMQHSFGEAAEFCLTTSEEELKADGEDLLFVEVSMKDAQGFPVVNANNRIQIEVSGAGALVGTDNGDSTDTDEYKSGNRRLFPESCYLCVRPELPVELWLYDSDHRVFLRKS